MTTHQAGCCCAECVEVGAMCICVGSQDFPRGCYENNTAQDAENENGLWLGAGTDCGYTSGSGCPDCCDGGGGFMLPSTRKKCCYQERIKTACNEWVVDDCATWKDAMLTKCECEMLQGEWGVIGKCQCNGDPIDCGAGRCCPSTSPPRFTTGTIVVIKSITYTDTYTIDWGCVDCHYDDEGCVNTTNVHEVTYSESKYTMNYSSWSAFLSSLTANDYHFVCTDYNDCSQNGTIQTCYLNADLKKESRIVAVYNSTCTCAMEGSAAGCSSQFCDCYYDHSLSESGRYMCGNCFVRTYEDSGSGIICC